MNVIDVTAKVCQYLDEMVVGSVGSSNKTASLQRLRGPGQPSMDPLQFVVPPSNVMDMAEKAKQLVNLTEQQKKMRGMEMDKNKQPNTVFEEEWQSDLDTWRRKRKNRLSAEADVKPSDIIQPKVEVKKCEESSAEINSSNSGFHRDIQRYTSKKTELHGIYTDDDSEDYSNEYHKNLKEEILTIRSPTAEDNNDSGIENNRNSSSHSPSTSLDFSPRSTDFLSPKSHTSSTENLPPPPPPPPSLPPFEASSPQPTRHLDQVLVPIPTVGATALHRPSPLEETVDYPPPPHHLRQTSVDRKLHNHTETDILTPNKARISATIPSSSYLREHTKVEPFVAQSIREHQIVTSKLPETNVDLTVELNREQKAIVSANKFPNREPSSASKRSETAANSAFPSDSLNSQYRFGSTEDYSQQERNNRTKSYYQYRNSQQNDNSTSRSTPTIQASRNLSHSVSTPTVSGNTMTAPSPSATTTLYRTVDIHFDDTSSTSTYQPPKRDKDGLIAITVELGAQPVHKGFGFSINCEKRQCLVDAVVVGTPADKQGLQIGDRIDSINGEKTADQFPSAINRAIHEATRMGEIHLRIERKDAYGNANVREPFGGSSRSLTSSDYRVTSLHDKVGPGKLSDFVPEVERARAEDGPRRRFVDSEETPRTIRNYQVSSSELGYRPLVQQTQHQNSGSSYKPAEINYIDEQQHNNQIHVESRDWRDVINQQRQAAPGNAADNQKIREVTASMSNLPSIIDRKHEESKKLIRDQNDFQYQNRDWKQSQPEIQTSRTEAFTSYNSLGYKPKPTNNFNNTASYKSNTLREEVSRYDDYQSKTIVNSSSTIQNPQKEAKEYTPSGYAEEKQDNVVAVSGKHRCAHCSTELGRGAAMIVESLNLYYHLACFKCFVCKTPLGSGATGTDVRVREGRLHCQSCYSNDKLQLSKV